MQMQRWETSRHTASPLTAGPAARCLSASIITLWPKGGSRMDVPPAGLSTTPPPLDLPPALLLMLPLLTPLPPNPQAPGGDSGSSAAHHVTLLAHIGLPALQGEVTDKDPPSCHSIMLCLLTPPPLTAPVMLLHSLPPGLLPPNRPAKASAWAALALGLSAAATAVARSLDVNVSGDLAPSSEGGRVPPGPLREPFPLAGGLQRALLCCCLLVLTVLTLWPGLLRPEGGGVLGGSESKGPAAAGAGLLVGSGCCCWNADELRVRLLLCLGEQMAALMAANLQSKARTRRVKMVECSELMTKAPTLGPIRIQTHALRHNSQGGCQML